MIAFFSLFLLVNEIIQNKADTVVLYSSDVEFSCVEISYKSFINFTHMAGETVTPELYESCSSLKERLRTSEIELGVNGNTGDLIYLKLGLEYEFGDRSETNSSLFLMVYLFLIFVICFWKAMKQIAKAKNIYFKGQQ